MVGMDRTNNQSGRPARSKQRGEMRGWTDKTTTPPRAGAAQARTPVVCLSCRRVFTSQHALGGHMPCTARAEDSSDGSFTFSGEESSSSDARPPPRQRTCIRPPAQDFPVAMPLPVIGQMVVSRPSSAELLRTGGVVHLDAPTPRQPSALPWATRLRRAVDLRDIQQRRTQLEVTGRSLYPSRFWNLWRALRHQSGSHQEQVVRAVRAGYCSKSERSKTPFPKTLKTNLQRLLADGTDEWIQGTLELGQHNIPGFEDVGFRFRDPVRPERRFRRVSG